MLLASLYIQLSSSNMMTCWLGEVLLYSTLLQTTGPSSWGVTLGLPPLGQASEVHCAKAAAATLVACWSVMPRRRLPPLCTLYPTHRLLQ